MGMRASFMGWLVSSWCLWLCGCGTGHSTVPDDGGPVDGIDGIDGEGAPDADVGEDAQEEELPPPTGARLHGIVWGPHPDGTDPIFPVSGALVAAFSAAPDPVPDTVYCEECIEIETSIPNTLSNPDGTFTLTVRPGAHYFMTVQKGQFRRVREYDAPPEAGDYDLLADMTTLPHGTDLLAGDTIPKIALLYGDYDHIEDVLAKVGIGQDDDAYGYDYDQPSPPFDMYDNGDQAHHGIDKMTLLGNLDWMRRYHIIFFNCSYNAIFSFMGDEALQERLRTYVSEGGKLYVSDYAMPVVEKPWPEFAWFTNPLTDGCNEADTDPPTCNHGPPFDAPSAAPDTSLNGWLDAQGLLDDGFLTRENWDTIGELFEGDMGTDPDTGELVRDLPHVWVEGTWNYDAETLTGFGHDPDTWDYETNHPMTISWQYGCGRVLFTTYHTVGTTTGGRHPGLYEQELSLFYLIMEIGVCQEQPLLI
jgi:hypothetical protein